MFEQQLYLLYRVEKIFSRHINIDQKLIEHFDILKYEIRLFNLLSLNRFKSNLKIIINTY